jgi:hypothetical protein
MMAVTPTDSVAHVLSEFLVNVGSRQCTPPTRWLTPTFGLRMRKRKRGSLVNGSFPLSLVWFTAE